MKIWLIKEGEPLPTDDNPRMMRTGLLAEYLDKGNHEVIWFSSTFSHGQKRERANKTTTRKIFKNSILIMLKTKTIYKKNVSLQRILYSEQLGKEFYRQALISDKPDLIICSYPLISFAKYAISIGEKFNTPVIIDIRDLWPDIFERAIPKKLRFLSKILLYPFQQSTSNILKKADCITAIVPSHLEWALKKAGRNRNNYDQVIHIGYKNFMLEEDVMEKELIQYYEQFSISKNTWNIIFIGTMSKMTMDLDTVIKGFNQLSKVHSNLRLILCGDGDALNYYKKIASSENIIFTGWINKNQIASLMRISKIALYPLHNLPDFINSLTNKVIEYMYGGLPIITSLRGYSKQYIEKNNIGIYYEEESVESFSQSIVTLYNNEEMRGKLSINSRNCYERDFDSDVINEKFEFLINDIVKIESKL